MAEQRIAITVTPVVDEDAVAAIRERFAGRPVPELTSPAGLAYSETPVEVAYERLRDDLAALRAYLVAIAESAAFNAGQAELAVDTTPDPLLSETIERP